MFQVIEKPIYKKSLLDGTLSPEQAAARPVIGHRYEIKDSETSEFFVILDSREKAEGVAFGLNNDFLQTFLGGFSEFVWTEIQCAMRGEIALDQCKYRGQQSHS